MTDVPVGTDHGGSFRVYMAHKRAKLDEQFADAGDASSKLFHNICVYVNGKNDYRRVA